MQTWICSNKKSCSQEIIWTHYTSSKLISLINNVFTLKCKLLAPAFINIDPRNSLDWCFNFREQHFLRRTFWITQYIQCPYSLYLQECFPYYSLSVQRSHLLDGLIDQGVNKTKFWFHEYIMIWKHFLHYCPLQGNPSGNCLIFKQGAITLFNSLRPSNTYMHK